MTIKYGLAEHYFRADQVHLAIIYEAIPGSERIWFLEPGLDFILEADGETVLIDVAPEDVHDHLDTIEIVEYIHEDEL